MSDINRRRDERISARCFFFQCPNIIFDLGLSSRELSLYLAIRRTAGDNGLCWRNTRSLAKMAGMSVGSVVKAKRHLCGPFQLLDWKSLIQITKEPNPQGGKARHIIKVVNIWQYNEKRYSQDELVTEHDSRFQQSSSSGDLVNSPSEIANLASEIKKTPIRKLNEENPPSTSPSKREIESADSDVCEFWNFVCMIFGRTDGRGPTRTEKQLMLQLLPVPAEERGLVNWWMTLDSEEYGLKREVSFLLRRRPRSVGSLLRNWSDVNDVARHYRDDYEDEDY